MKNKKPQCKKNRPKGTSKRYLKVVEKPQCKINRPIIGVKMSTINNMAIFIVTYKTEKLLEENIQSILDSDIKKFVNNFTITVINNYHEKFDIEKFDRIKFAKSSRLNGIIFISLEKLKSSRKPAFEQSGLYVYELKNNTYANGKAI